MIFEDRVYTKPNILTYHAKLIFTVCKIRENGFFFGFQFQSSKVISGKYVPRSGIMADVEDISGQTSDAAKVIEVIVLCLIIIAAVVGNISIWIIIINSKALRTITNMFILGLSAADLLVSIANMPMTVYAVISGSWPLSDAACVIFGYINMLTLVTSVLSLCNISINRYFMVCKPSKFQGIYTKRNAVFMIFGKCLYIFYVYTCHCKP